MVFYDAKDYLSGAKRLPFAFLQEIRRDFTGHQQYNILVIKQFKQKQACLFKRSVGKEKGTGFGDPSRKRQERKP